MKENKENLYSLVAQSFAAPALPLIRELNNKNWVYYGETNLFPDRLIELYNTSAIHHTCAQAVKDGIFGEGISTVGTEYINTKGETIDDIFEKITLDYTLFQGYALNVIWSKDKSKISEIYHLPFNNVRSGKMDEDEEVLEYYYTNKWEDIRKYPPVAYRSFDPIDNSGDNASQIFYYYEYTPGNAFYPLPSYQAGVSDITLDAKVSVYHVNNISNGLSPSMFIAFKNGIPTPEARKDIYSEIANTYSGETNSGRFFLSFSDADTVPEVTPISATNDGYYLTLEERISSRILSSWRISSPLLLGLHTGSTGFSSNADEIRVAYSHFEGTVIEPKRKKLTSSYGYILKLAGYNVKIEVIPNRLIALPAEGIPAVIEDSIQDAPQLPEDTNNNNIPQQ